MEVSRLHGAVREPLCAQWNQMLLPLRLLRQRLVMPEVVKLRRRPVQVQVWYFKFQHAVLLLPNR